MRAEMTHIASRGKLSITINGEPRRIAPGLSIACLVSELGLNPKKVAVEHNLQIVPRSTLADVLLADGDQLEIVHFVGGG
jgi:sulfur carrier protein